MDGMATFEAAAIPTAAAAAAEEEAEDEDDDEGWLENHEEKLKWRLRAGVRKNSRPQGADNVSKGAREKCFSDQIRDDLENGRGVINGMAKKKPKIVNE